MGDICSLKQRASAQNYYEKAVKIFESLYGIDSCECISIYNNMAGMYLTHNEFQKAEELCLKALDILSKTKGTET
jgi:tetratricopeptide (TPR) repeat protein